MVMQVALTHRTSYRYDRPIHLGPQVIRLRPAAHNRNKVVSYSLTVEPRPHFLNWQQDPQNNFLARVVFPEKVEHFDVTVDLVTEMQVINPFDFFLEPEYEEWPWRYPDGLRKELEAYLEVREDGALLKTYVDAIEIKKERIIDFLVRVNAAVQRDIGYTIRMEPGIQSCEQTLQLKSGSCRDSAWLLVQILRHLGIAARFVSGYLIQLAADQKPLDGPAGPAEDFTDLHAWTEIFLPGAGWVGLDPTSGLFAAEGHIPLAASPDPTSAAPITGTLDPCEVTFEHHMAISRIKETTRVTKPYTPAQWQAIDALGEQVDVDLQANDVRLTVGGEPTFVSIDDMDGDEWTTAAVGPTKRGLAHVLITRLQQRFAPNGFLHYGQGKWYPGEQLPRWAFALYWRGDGAPVWHHPHLIADERVDYQPTMAQAHKLLLGICDRLEIEHDNALPVYEDAAYFTVRERQLPPNVDPIDSKVDDPQERARLAEVFRRGLSQPRAYVLPIQAWNTRDGRIWASERWQPRGGNLFLIPGDSPAGLRLPLSSLPYIPAADYPQVLSADPFSLTQPLPSRADPRRRPYQERNRPRAGDSGMPMADPLGYGGAVDPSGQQPGHAAPAGAGSERDTDAERDEAFARNERERRAFINVLAVRTAMAVEPRGGRLCVFMPPCSMTEDYLEIVTAIEDTALELGTPVHIEGYTPPNDHRINVIKVTPDPGVIEVNVHPAHTWREQVQITEALYEEARLSRLGTEKFMLDGRHTGTGGGNHVVIGGRSPADSPFLRRPDLLRSLISYWQNHPSLSYLFSGLFIGPTSQAPRIDEARHESLYEMGLALAQIPDPDGTPCPAWLVDRILRDLLVDVSGNTHRAEICIDKLYSPDGPAGRLGLVEFRAFEMPPHAHMSLAQSLLVRALIAWFWQQPYKAPLVPWGTLLHDKFMLPYYVWQDFRGVLADLNRAGYGVDPAWFDAHFQFRFPMVGEVRYEGVHVELRQALEPWHVTGEDGAIGGTARYVDSSLERLQVKVSGQSGDRYVITCNGERLPLRATEAAGEQVAGVRYRAWQPPRCLHPNIKVHAPLVFDVIDTWSGRSIGGCQYHVEDYSGRNPETFPINGAEAESRRSARFFPFGHSSGHVAVPPLDPNPDYPHTLDLRRASVRRPGLA